jgi:beta-lactamase class C
MLSILASSGSSVQTDAYLLQKWAASQALGGNGRGERAGLLKNVVVQRVVAGLGIVLAAVGLLWATGLLRFVGSVPNGATNQAAGSAAVRAEVPPVVTSGPSAIDYARLEQRLRTLVERENMVGLAVGVVENGQIRFVKGFGTVASNSQEPVTENTVFRWASVSKGVAADMVSLLAARGQLSLEDPVGRWSATLKLPGGNETRATVANMLSHTLGIPGHAHDARLEGNEDPRFLRQLLAFLPQSCEPGACHAYQNVAYDGATDVVEKVTGKTYKEALQENFFTPLGMSTASATREGLVSSASWARPHRGRRNSRPEEVLEPYYRVPSAGGVNGSIMDLTLWMRANMGLAPEVLPQAALEAVQTPRINTPGETRRRARFHERTPSSQYGLGWRVLTYAGHTVVGHHGGVLGYRSLILFDPERKSGVVALWNCATSRPNGIEYEIMDMIYGLPFRDWIQLGGGEAPAGEEQAAD